MSKSQECADFHLHCKPYSFDGALSLRQIEDLARRNNVKWISITDHNNIKAPIKLWSARREDLSSPYIVLDSGIKVVSGVEVTCRVMPVANLKGNPSKVHILIYGADLSPASPIVRLMDIKAKNDIDFDLRKLNYLLSFRPDKKVSIEEIQDWFRKNNIDGEPSNKELIDFLDDKGIDLGIYTEKKLTKLLEEMPEVERLDLNVEEVIKVAHASGGIAVMAHPGLNLRRTSRKMDLLEVLIKSGIDGFEMLYHGVNSDTADLIDKAVRKFAKRRSMVYTGGSDTHDVSEGNTVGFFGKGRPITLASQEYGLIKRLHPMMKAYRKHQSRIKYLADVEKYISDCYKIAQGISVKKSKNKSIKPSKKHYKEKPTPLEFFYTSGADLFENEKDF